MIEHLQKILADVFFFSFKAHSFHWNVRGMMFKPLHDFFGEIYDDGHSSIDVFAEYIRIEGGNAPHSITELYGYNSIPELQYIPGTGREMIMLLAKDNDLIIEKLSLLFVEAETRNLQGIADYVAGRLDTHKKFGWMLSSHLSD